MILGGLQSELNASLIFCLLLLFFVCFFVFCFVLFFCFVVFFVLFVFLLIFCSVVHLCWAKHILLSYLFLGWVWPGLYQQFSLGWLGQSGQLASAAHRP